MLKTNRIMGLSAALREGKIWDDSHLRMWQLFWVAMLGISLTMKKRPQQMTNAITIMTTIFRILWFFSRQTARACFDFKSFNSDLCLKFRMLREYKTMIAIRGRMKRNTKPPPRKIRESWVLLIDKEQNVSFPSTTIWVFSAKGKQKPMGSSHDKKSGMARAFKVLKAVFNG